MRRGMVRWFMRIKPFARSRRARQFIHRRRSLRPDVPKLPSTYPVDRDLANRTTPRRCLRVQLPDIGPGRRVYAHKFFGPHGRSAHQELGPNSRRSSTELAGRATCSEGPFAPEAVETPSPERFHLSRPASLCAQTRLLSAPDTHLRYSNGQSSSPRNTLFRWPTSELRESTHGQPTHPPDPSRSSPASLTSFMRINR